MTHDLAVSVVIPTWNEAGGIAATLRAVPTVVDEVIVVDAGSDDGTADYGTVEDMHQASPHIIKQWLRVEAGASER